MPSDNHMLLAAIGVAALALLALVLMGGGVSRRGRCPCCPAWSACVCPGNCWCRLRGPCGYTGGRARGYAGGAGRPCRRSVCGGHVHSGHALYGHEMRGHAHLVAI